MTKDKAVYETPLRVIMDPRASYTEADRRVQFDLTMRLYNMLGDMTTAVDRINRTRAALDLSAAKASDPALQERLRSASGQVDEIRRKIVATKEGGAITGEERLREFLADLYGNVNRWEGLPSQTQVERTDALQKEMADVVKEFDTWAAAELPKINAALSAAKMDTIPAN
jgi:hypothetical protein